MCNYSDFCSFLLLIKGVIFFLFQAVEILKRAPERTRLLLDRSLGIKPDALEESDRSSTELNESIKRKSVSKTNDELDDIFEVRIKKNQGGLGLSLAGGREASPAFKGEFHTFPLLVLFYHHSETNLSCQLDKALKNL